jgi:hypothetical protein
MARLSPVCWLWAQDATREPDEFFRNEDLFAAFALRLNRVDDAFRLFDALAARSFSPAARAAFDKEDARRQRRLARSKRPVQYESVPFWHDGVLARLAALEVLRVEAPAQEERRNDAG